MKIVYCIHSTFNSGGMERVLANKVNYLAENLQYEVLIITIEQKRRTPFFSFNSRVKFIDLDINYADENECSFFRKTYSFLKKRRIHKKRLSTVLSELKSDIVISMFGNEASFLCDIEDGSKKILEIHFSKYFRIQQGRAGLWWLVDKYRSFIDEHIIKQYDKFVVLTHEDKELWGASENIQVIHNGSVFNPDKAANLVNKRVISVGRLNYQKGYDMLVQCWALVHSRHPDWKLVIVGSGEELGQRKDQIGKLKLFDSIDILDPTSAIEEEYLKSSIYAMSSRYEGFPMVLLEAMACGVPVVSFACKCGPRDMITSNRDGILVDCGDIVGLADGLCRLIETPQMRLEYGEKAKKTVNDRFSQEIIMKQWLDLFVNLTK